MRACCLAVLIVGARAVDAQQYRTPEQLIPPWTKGAPRVMECQASQLTDKLDCLPVRFLPSVRFSRTKDNQLTVSAPDPSRALWVQASGISPREYSNDIAAAPDVAGMPPGMPPNYFCIDLSPALSGSGAAILLFDARIRLEGDNSSIRISGALSSGPTLISQLSAAIPWPGSYAGTTPPPATVRVHLIGPGCRNFPAISFTPTKTADGGQFLVEDVFVFVSIP